MSTAPATVATLLGHLPGLTRKQTTTITVATPAPDGDYSVTLADAGGEATALDSDPSSVRDDLLDGLDATALAVVAASGSRALTIVGVSYGVAVPLSTDAPTGGFTVETVQAAGVPESILDLRLAMAKRLVASSAIWGDMLATGQALRCLHLLARTGELQAYGAEYEGEQGQLAISSLGPSSSSFAVAPVSEGSDGDLAATKWGRLYLELWRTIRVRATGQVLR